MSHPRPTDTPPAAPHRPRFRINRNVGTGAGLLAFAIVVFALGGAVWGLVRPAYEAMATGDGQLALSAAGNVNFTAFSTFTVVTGLLGVVTGAYAFMRAPETRGLPMLLWTGVVGFIAAVGFWAVGETVAGLVHPLPDPSTLAEGDVVEVAAALNPGMGLVAAPFMATAAYWVCVLLYPGDLEEPEDAEDLVEAEKPGSPEAVSAATPRR